MHPPGIILLAAGASSRMGQPKQLLRFEGETLLRRAAQTAVEARLGPVIVVLGHRAADMEPEISGLRVHIAFNPDWSRGIGSSIRCGVQKLKIIRPDANRTIILLCDHPLIRPEHLGALVDAYRQSKLPVCIASFREEMGPPVLLAASVFADLSTLEDGRGAKSLWINRPDLVCKVSCPEAGIDIDTPEDYARLLHPT